MSLDWAWMFQSDEKKYDREEGGNGGSGICTRSCILSGGYDGNVTQWFMDGVQEEEGDDNICDLVYNT